MSTTYLSRFSFALALFKLIFTLIKWILNTIKLFLEQYTRENIGCFCRGEPGRKEQKVDFLLYHLNFETCENMFHCKKKKKKIKRIIQAHNLKINSVKRKFSAPLISTPTLNLSFFRSVYFSTLSAASSHTWSHISKKDVLVALSRSICFRACQFISSYGIWEFHAVTCHDHLFPLLHLCNTVKSQLFWWNK